MNTVLAWIVVILWLVYMVVELGWGGSRSDFATYHRPRDPLWPRWRWRPPDPKGPSPAQPVKPKPRLPETLDS